MGGITSDGGGLTGDAPEKTYLDAGTKLDGRDLVIGTADTESGAIAIKDEHECGLRETTDRRRYATQSCDHRWIVK